MIDSLKFKIDLWRLHKLKAKACSAYVKNLALARAEGKKKEDIRSLESSALFEEDMINEEISILVTSYLTSKATKYFIAIPEHNVEGMWEQCNKISNQFVLTNTGISTLQSSLRAEARERRDLIIPYISVITGIIGTAIGLVAALKK